MIDNRNSVAQALGFFHVMGRVDDRLSLPFESSMPVEDEVARLRMTPTGRLVEHQNRRIMNQRGGEIESAFHAPENAPASFFPCPADPRIQAPRQSVLSSDGRYTVELSEKLQVFGGRQPIINRDRLRRVADTLADVGPRRVVGR